MKEKCFNEVKDLVIHPGCDETKRRFTWYNSQKVSGAKLQYALKTEYEAEGRFTDKNSTIVEGRCEIPYMNKTDLSCKAEIEDLELGTEYVYRVGSDDFFDDNIYSFKTHKVDKKQVFAVISDIHNNMKNNTSLTEEEPAKRIQFCNNIYDSLMKFNPEIQFIISTGDSMSVGGNGYTVDDSNKDYYRMVQELETDLLFAPDIFRKIPFISTIGNHDTMQVGEPYGGITKYHYNLPNDDGVRGTYINTNHHGNWWFRNGEVLIIGILLNETIKTDAYANVTPEVNKAYILEALAKNEDAKWRIVVNHIPAYSAVVHRHEGYDIRELYAELDLDNLGIDAVISGHQHAYLRSKQLLTNKYEDTVYTECKNIKGDTILLMQPKVVSEDVIKSHKDENGNCVAVATNPEGVVHIGVPALIYNAHRYLASDFKTFSGEYGITSEEMKYIDETKVDADCIKDAIRFSPSSCLFVTVEKSDDGFEQIKFEFVKNNATETKISDKCEVLDTYIIKKLEKNM